MNRRKKILWLVSWYPNRDNPFDGDFIQRHAKAAAIYNDIYVLFVTEADNLKVTETIINRYTGLTEEIIYYNRKRGPIGKLLKQYQWFKHYKNAVTSYIQHNDLPDLVHVHIPWKAGLIGLWIKNKYGIPFIVTEHWGIYNRVLKDNYYTKPAYFKQIVKKTLEEAKVVTSVSKYLLDGLNKTAIIKSSRLIPNVVDTSLFYRKDQKHAQFSFIHVSNMVPLKNVSEILIAFRKLVSEVPLNVQLIMIGNTDDKYVKEAERMELLNKNIFFRGEIKYKDVAEEMQRSHCLILNSFIENAPCVISEALCCGLPVIATAVGGIPEMINVSNGYLIEPGMDNLLRAMQSVLNEYERFDKQSISDNAKRKYGYNIISEKFADLYA